MIKLFMCQVDSLIAYLVIDHKRHGKNEKTELFRSLLRHPAVAVCNDGYSGHVIYLL